MNSYTHFVGCDGDGASGSGTPARDDAAAGVFNEAILARDSRSVEIRLQVGVGVGHWFNKIDVPITYLMMQIEPDEAVPLKDGESVYLLSTWRS